MRNGTTNSIFKNSFVVIKRCIFCGCDSSQCRSVEHIIPESLGNDSKELILDKGCVCDKCNNYFSTNVENPFLSLDSIKRIRFEFDVPSKKGRVPTTDVLVSNEKCEFRRINGELFVAADSKTIKRILEQNPRHLIVKTASIDEMQNSYIVSRMLAKMAFELVVKSFLDCKNTDEDTYIEIEDGHPFAKLRDYARNGDFKNRIWPYSVQNIELKRGEDGKCTYISIGFVEEDNKEILIFKLARFEFKFVLFTYLGDEAYSPSLRYS